MYNCGNSDILTELHASPGKTTMLSRCGSKLCSDSVAVSESKHLAPNRNNLARIGSLVPLPECQIEFPDDSDDGEGDGGVPTTLLPAQTLDYNFCVTTGD